MLRVGKITKKKLYEFGCLNNLSIRILMYSFVNDSVVLNNYVLIFILYVYKNKIKNNYLAFSNIEFILQIIITTNNVTYIVSILLKLLILND